MTTITNRTLTLQRLTVEVHAGSRSHLLHALKQSALILRTAEDPTEGPMDPGPITEAYALCQGAVDRATGACQEGLPW